MKNEKIQASPFNAEKRESLKKIALGGGIAGTAYWYKPVVQSVALPAHASSSQNGEFFGGFDVVGSMHTPTNDISATELIAAVERGPLDWIVSPVEAAAVLELPIHICVTIINGAFDAQFQNKNEYYTLSGNVGDEKEEMNSTCDCTLVQFTVDSVSAAGAHVIYSLGKSSDIFAIVDGPVCDFYFGCNLPE